MFLIRDNHDPRRVLRFTDEARARQAMARLSQGQPRRRFRLIERTSGQSLTRS